VAVEQLTAYLVAQSMPTDVAAISREHVEAFIIDLLEHWRASSGQARWPA